MESEVIQLIFCVETTENAQTDKKYINEILNKYYNVGENKISYVFMNGKYNYKNDNTLKRIQRYIRDYEIVGSGKSHVIYVCDKDLNTQDPRDNAFVKELKQYCRSNGHKLIWFVKTIEDVMWGKTIKKQSKKKKANQFISLNQIKNVRKNQLSAASNVNAPHKSNVLSVLNQFKPIR